MYDTAMRCLIVLLIGSMLLYAPQAVAAGAEAREIARQNNCTPKKVEIFQQKVGATMQTIYRVECILPKAVDDKAPKMATAVLIQCDGTMCELLRPLYDPTN